jgi:hypothetical protein
MEFGSGLGIGVTQLIHILGLLLVIGEDFLRAIH